MGMEGRGVGGWLGGRERKGKNRPIRTLPFRTPSSSSSSSIPTYLPTCLPACLPTYLPLLQYNPANNAWHGMAWHGGPSSCTGGEGPLGVVVVAS